MIQLSIQLKQEYADTNYTPQETGYWLPCLQASALFMQGLNQLLAEELIHGPIACNPTAMVYHPPTYKIDTAAMGYDKPAEISEDMLPTQTFEEGIEQEIVYTIDTPGYFEGSVEGFLGNVNTPPNEFGVMTIVLENYAALKIPYLPPEAPFSIYLGDTSEKKEVGTDEEGNPIYETVYAGVIQ